MRKDTSLDERAVSWKVLLPTCQESRVLALGLRDGALRALGRTFRHVDTSPNGQKYDIVVFGEQGPSPQPTEEYFSHMTANGVLVAVGVPWIRGTIRQARWQCVAEYACLPSNRPRIFVPLGSKRVREEALDFHSPGSLKSKAWLWGAKGLSSIGITSHLRRKTVAFFTAGNQMNGEGSLKRWISRKAGWSAEEIVVYAGSESAARKITALVMSFDCCRQVVARIADTGLATSAINRESTALSVLARTSLSGSVPSLIAEGECGAYTIQLQSCLPKVHGQCSTLSRAHIGFLSALSQINRASVPLHKTKEWQIVIGAVNSPEAVKLPEAIRCIASRLMNNSTAERSVDCHMIHGDFAPWNIICQNDSILAYDWEDSNLSGFPFHDIFHFIYRQASLVGPWPGPAAVLKMMRDAAASLAHTSDIQSDVYCALAVWCIKEYAYKPDFRLVDLATELERMNHE